jgi:tetratricopeptide (TPR) repeat protein
MPSETKKIWLELQIPRVHSCAASVIACYHCLVMTVASQTSRAKKGVLSIESASSQATLNGKTLPINSHWLYVYALLALRWLEGKPTVTFEELNRLPTWTHVEAKSLRTSLFRHVDTMMTAGLELIVSPLGERTKRFSLNPALVRSVKFDACPEDIRDWLGLYLEKAESSALDVRLLTLVGSAELAFEQGRYDDAESFVASVLKGNPSIEQRVQVLALDAWIKSFRAPREVAWDAVQELHAIRLAHSLPPALEAGIWIQEGRYYTKHRDIKAAKRVYTRASKLAGPDDDRVWGGVHFGLGYIAQWEGKLEESMGRYQLSLQHFSKARWAWGMQAQYNNLAAVCFLQHDRFESSNPKRAARWLTDAIRWLEETRVFVEQMDFGGAADLECNLAYAYRITGQHQAAREMLRYGWNLANAAHSVCDQGLVCAELAELEQALGNQDRAVAEYERAVGFFGALQTQDWFEACQQRLAELRGEKPLGKALKLW